MRSISKTHASRVFVGALLILVVGSLPAQSATVGLFLDWGLSSSCAVGKFVPPMVNVLIRDLDVPIAALHFALETASGIAWYPIPAEWYSPATGEVDDLMIRFGDCRGAAEVHYLELFYLPSPWSLDRDDICIGPPESNPFEPAAIFVETCEGDLIPLTLAETIPAEVPNGCIWACKIVALENPSWGMFKAAF